VVDGVGHDDGELAGVGVTGDEPLDRGGEGRVLAVGQGEGGRGLQAFAV
jgi:hypothetical protein